MSISEFVYLPVLKKKKGYLYLCSPVRVFIYPEMLIVDVLNNVDTTVVSYATTKGKQNSF